MGHVTKWMAFRLVACLAWEDGVQADAAFHSLEASVVDTPVLNLVELDERCHGRAYLKIVQCCTLS